MRPRPPPIEDEGWPPHEPFKDDHSLAWIAIVVLLLLLSCALAWWLR